MNKIRRFAYAALLALATLNFAPSLASGQEAVQGKFTLTHDVRWENLTVPAGEYSFSFGSDDVGRVLSLTELSGAHRGFFLLVRDTEDAKPGDRSQLIVERSVDGSAYVSAMQLPEFGVTMLFRKPSERQIARAGTAGVPGQ
jgi:hypothetical protein